VEIPDDFDWGYFQTVAADQQTRPLAGDEWLLLEGMHPTAERLQCGLPRVRAEARLWSRAATRSHPGLAIPLVADGLAIDVEARCLTVCWRGNFPLPAVDALSGVGVGAAVSVRDEPVDWGPYWERVDAFSPDLEGLEAAPSTDAPDSDPQQVTLPFVKKEPIQQDGDSETLSFRPTRAAPTKVLSDEEVAELQARPSTPFGRRPATASNAIRPAPQVQVTLADAEPGDTAPLLGQEIERLRAQFALPFKTPLSPSPPSSASSGAASSMVQAATVPPPPPPLRVLPPIVLPAAAPPLPEGLTAPPSAAQPARAPKPPAPDVADVAVSEGAQADGLGAALLAALARHARPQA
jgi:hypothetical protein